MRRLTPSEVDALPAGATVHVRWAGGIAIWPYTVHVDEDGTRHALLFACRVGPLGRLGDERDQVWVE